MTVLSPIFGLAILILCWRAAKRLAPGLAELAIISSLLVSGAIMVSASILGLAGLLYQPLWAFTAAVISGGFCLAARKSAFADIPGASRFAEYWSPAAALLALLLAILAALSITVIITSDPSNIDDLFYHYTKFYHLARSHSLELLGLEIVDGYPQGGEIIGLFVYSLTGKESLLDGSQFLIMPLFWTAAFSLAQSLALAGSRRYALVAALSACFIPALWSLLITFHVDIFSTAFLLAALCFALEIYDGRRGREALLGLALGLAAATKFVALPAAAVLPLAVWLTCSRTRTLPSICAVLVPLILAGAPHYVLNIVRFNNPIFPYDLSLAGLHLQGKGVQIGAVWGETMAHGASGWMRVVTSWFAPSSLAQTNHEHWYGGFGLMWPLLLVFMLGALVGACRVRDNKFIWFMCVALLLFLSTPVRFSARFVLFIVPVAAGGCARFLETLGAKHKWLAFGATCLLIVAALHCTRQVITNLQSAWVEQRYGSIREACLAAARPPDLRQALHVLDSEAAEITRVIGVLGSGAAERNWSFACLWQIFPNAGVFFADETAARHAPGVPAGSAAFVSRSYAEQLQAPVFEGARQIFQGKDISVFVNPGLVLE